MELNPNIFWCPEAGCDQAVGMETANDRVVPVASPAECEPQTVQCGNGHLFCWLVHLLVPSVRIMACYIVLHGCSWQEGEG